MNSRWLIPLPKELSDIDGVRTESEPNAIKLLKYQGVQEHIPGVCKQTNTSNKSTQYHTE